VRDEDRAFRATEVRLAERTARGWQQSKAIC
jgi:hypothetical protein